MRSPNAHVSTQEFSVCVQQSNTLSLPPVYLKKKSCVHFFVILVLATNNKKGSRDVLQGTGYVQWVNVKWTVLGLSISR